MAAGAVIRAINTTLGIAVLCLGLSSIEICAQMYTGYTAPGAATSSKGDPITRWEDLSQEQKVWLQTALADREAGHLKDLGKFLSENNIDWHMRIPRQHLSTNFSSYGYALRELDLSDPTDISILESMAFLITAPGMDRIFQNPPALKRVKKKNWMGKATEYEEVKNQITLKDVEHSANLFFKLRASGKLSAYGRGDAAPHLEAMAEAALKTAGLNQLPDSEFRKYALKAMESQWEAPEKDLMKRLFGTKFSDGSERIETTSPLHSEQPTFNPNYRFRVEGVKGDLSLFDYAIKNGVTLDRGWNDRELEKLFTRDPEIAFVRGPNAGEFAYQKHRQLKELVFADHRELSLEQAVDKLHALGDMTALTELLSHYTMKQKPAELERIFARLKARSDNMGGGEIFTMVQDQQRIQHPLNASKFVTSTLFLEAWANTRDSIQSFDPDTISRLVLASVAYGKTHPSIASRQATDDYFLRKGKLRVLDVSYPIFASNDSKSILSRWLVAFHARSTTDQSPADAYLALEELSPYIAIEPNITDTAKQIVESFTNAMQQNVSKQEILAWLKAQSQLKR